jgi:hypothetical protein
MMANAVANAERMGIPYVNLDAAKSTSENGYYTWARMGFDAPLGGEMRHALPSKLEGARSLNDLMRRPAAAWWKQNGERRIVSLSTDPNSVGRKIMDGYLKEKGLSTFGRVAGGGSCAPRTGCRVDLRPDTENEAILDRVWKKLASG